MSRSRRLRNGSIGLVFGERVRDVNERYCSAVSVNAGCVAE